MPQETASGPEEFTAEAERLLEEIARGRKKLEGLPGVLDGTLDRFRERVDRLIRESEVENWRQVRIFLRDVDGIASDLAKAAKEKRLAPKHMAALDLALRKARKRDFYGARKAWRRLDRIAEQTAEVRRLQDAYRDRYRGVEARIRSLRADVERLRKIPEPPVSPEDASAFASRIDAFSAAVSMAYLDFLARAPAEIAIPILLEASQGGGIGLPAPPRGTEAEPLLQLLRNEDPARASLRAKSFYGLLEIPGLSDAKLTHLMGDARLVRSALEAAWPWLKLLRDDAHRSLRVEWTEDAEVLKRRLPGIVAFAEKFGTATEATGLGAVLVRSLSTGDFQACQRAARIYTTHGKDAEAKWSGDLEKDADRMTKEASALSAALKGVPEPAHESGR